MIKKNSKNLIDELDSLINECYSAFPNHGAWKRARELMYGSLNCLGRHTLTGILSAAGNQFQDWTSAYRLFSQDRIDIEKIMNVAQANVLKETSGCSNIYAHMDDTIIKKTGKKIPGTAWRRDPLGPPFHTNFIWGQRFIQISMALPIEGEAGQSRAIPVDFHHCPTVLRPKKNAGQQEIEKYKEEKKIAKLSKQGSERIKLLRENLDIQGAADKQLIMSVDGSYTNSEVLKNLPQRVTLIGRIRKDTKLFASPEKQPLKGRKRVYGEQLPTPEQIRQSDQYEWQEVKAWAAGKTHDFNVKVVNNVRWKSAGQDHDLKLVVIRPLGYRLSKGSKILYRQPAYLICSDTGLDLQTLLQSYLWRWEIEVNFREEKLMMGCGQAQVRNNKSAENVPAFIAATYALLHIASHRAYQKSNNHTIPRPKWYPNKNKNRITTGDILNNIRAHLHAKAVGMNFDDFVNKYIGSQSHQNKKNLSVLAPFFVRN